MSPHCRRNSIDGRIFFEAHRDPYRKKSQNPLQFVSELATANNIDQAIDWKKARDVTSRNEGVAREIGAMPR